MKNIKFEFLLFFLALAMCSCSYSTWKHCSGVALVIPKEQFVNVYNAPNGDVISSIIDDPDADCYVLKINMIKAGYAFADIINLTTDHVQTGWMELSNIGIKPNGYTTDLLLYKSPSEKSEVLSVIQNPYWEYYIIKKCYKDWFYVIHESNGVIYQGWMPADRQCSNPFTTCN